MKRYGGAGILYGCVKVHEKLWRCAGFPSVRGGAEKGYGLRGSADGSVWVREVAGGRRSPQALGTPCP